MRTLGELLISAEQRNLRAYHVCDKKRVVAIAVYKDNGEMKFLSSINGLVKAKSDYCFDEDNNGQCCPYKETPQKTCMAMHAEQLVALKLLDRPQIKPDFVISSHCPCVTCLKWLVMAKVPKVLFIEKPLEASIEFASKLLLELIQVDRRTMLIDEMRDIVVGTFELQHRGRR